MTGRGWSIPGEAIAMRGRDRVAMPQQNDAFPDVPPRLTMLPRQDQQRAQALVRTPAPDGWWGPTVRTLGVEEELLLVDARTGRPLALAERVRSRLLESRGVGSGRDQGASGGHVTSEMQQQQIEIVTPTRTRLDDLEGDLRGWRAATGEAVADLGGCVVATGSSPVPVTPTATVDPRYAAMIERFGLTAREQLTCGCHVHVGVACDDEAVGVLDRIRPWLPALLAISANSPFWQGQDTGFASFRSQAWGRWPTAGPTNVFGSAVRYHSSIADLMSTGVLLDRGMVYFDARLSASFPTVEIRVADVCLHVEDATLLAALCRGLVDTAAEGWALRSEVPQVPTELLRLANWQAGHDGVDGSLLDPFTARPRPAADVLADLLAHVTPALAKAGDLEGVERQLHVVLRRGNGARRQRELADGDMAAVVAHLARTTLD
jgi:glutamate---cysteine ligase / carboxylate-amine ligase